MAVIRVPRWVWDKLEGDTVRVTASCWIRFTPYELTQIEQGLTFSLRCRLWGADSFLAGGDDCLFVYPLLNLPQDEPKRNENATFEAIVARSLLNEDSWDGDEIYALFELTNLYTNERVKRKSPQIETVAFG